MPAFAFAGVVPEIGSIGRFFLQSSAFCFCTCVTAFFSAAQICFCRSKLSFFFFNWKFQLASKRRRRRRRPNSALMTRQPRRLIALFFFFPLLLRRWLRSEARNSSRKPILGKKERKTCATFRAKFAPLAEGSPSRTQCGCNALIVAKCTMSALQRTTCHVTLLLRNSSAAFAGSN